MEDKIIRPKPVVLVIMDGWGITQHYNGNATTLARTPCFSELINEYPTTTIRASGESVGLPWGEMGNSEVGHLNLGLGRIIYQDLSMINKAISDKTFYQNETLCAALDHCRQHHSKLHLLGLTSNGNVHSSIDHLHALLQFCRLNDFKDICIHAILDGRDTAYNSGLNFIHGIESSLEANGAGRIATLSGRFYALDRNNNWDRTQKAYVAFTEGIGNKSDNTSKAIETSYKKKIYDEEFIPTVIEENGRPVGLIEDKDAVIFFNYRPDRARQIAKAFVQPDFEKFKRKSFLANLFFAAFTEYEQDLPVKIVFPPQNMVNCLGEVIANAKLKQLRIAETEKYAHVTYFFNGGREERFWGEDHILVPSPSVSSYDMKPEMSAEEVTKKILDAISQDIYDFIVINYANPDMVGHTGNLSAGIKAVEMVDGCVSRVVKAVLDKDGVVLVTADHGNVEEMFNMQTGQIDKEHSTNPVPFIVIGKEYRGRNYQNWPNVVGNDLSLIYPQGVLSDVAPTILKILGLKVPKEMTGFSMI